MNPIIKVQNLGKKYTLRHEHPERYVALRDVMAKQAKKLFSFPQQWRARASKPDFEEFWALKDLNFDIQPGDRVGIIGRNGAGKSTLLKILSRITAPSTGRIELNGRVASLLEVGTGFHPELSGRENIFLNGAILGMSRQEIRRKFDEIVDFSGVEKFLDTPVKRYSSGMYVRLAFAVAAHLEPEILVVDEVLAVGDAEFQKKCLGKMEDVSRNEGRTVLFVSHNLGVVQQLCNVGLYLVDGKINTYGSINNSINKYLSNQKQEKRFIVKDENKLKKIYFTAIAIVDKNNNTKETFFHDETIKIQFDIKFNIPIEKHDYSIFVIILSADKSRVFSAESIVLRTEQLWVELPSKFLVRGKYSIDAFIHKPKIEQIDIVEDQCNFEIIDNDSPMKIHENFDYGKVFANVKWTTN